MSKVDFSKYDLIMFDLDNTLYDEKLYLFEAYNLISNYIVTQKPKLSKYEILKYLKNQFLLNGRNNLFENLNNKYELKIEIINYLKIMRNFSLKNKISLSSKGKKLLKCSINLSSVCIVTNGNVIQQKNKIELIDWLGFKNKIKFYLANSIAPKPSKKIFSKIMKENKINFSKSVLMIGDSLTDFTFSKNIGCNFFYIDEIDC